MAQSKGKVIGSRNDVAVPKMKGTLLRKVGFFLVTNAHARAGAVGVCGSQLSSQSLSSLQRRRNGTELATAGSELLVGAFCF
jgi:hypothetical protein